VDTQWELSLPAAANPFDYSAIADVLVRVDYTALDDADYRAFLVRRLNTQRTVGSDCVVSLARDFPDQWYELNNPDPIDPDPSVTINVAASAFPHGLEQLSTTAVAIGLTPASSPLPEARVTLRRTISDATAGGDTDTAGGIASTRRGAAAWSPLTGVDPTGDWQLALRTTGGDPYAVGQLSDLVMIVSWRGDAPAWPD